jgi:hypothetical protein
LRNMFNFHERHYRRKKFRGYGVFHPYKNLEFRFNAANQNSRLM